MKISKKEIDHIAHLARLELSEDELKKYSQELSTILDYIGMLNEVDTKDVEATAQVSGLSDVFRLDEVKDWDRAEREASFSQADLEGRAVRVKRVLE